MEEYFFDEDESFEERRARDQMELIEKLLERLEGKYLTREKMYKKILFDPRGEFSLSGTLNRIDVLDAVRVNIKTSLMFNNYRRATWYLAMLDRMCRKYF